MQVSGVSLPRGRRACIAINDQLQSGPSHTAQAFVQVRAPRVVGPGVVACGHADDSSDAIRRLLLVIISIIGQQPRRVETDDLTRRTATTMAEQRRVGCHWRLRQVMAEHNLWKTFRASGRHSELRRESVHRLDHVQPVVLVNGHTMPEHATFAWLERV